jgi:hypothetical protein
MLALLAYVITDPNVFYVEGFPVVATTNAFAAALTQSARQWFYPIWNAGINGTGQVGDCAIGGEGEGVIHKQSREC